MEITLDVTIWRHHQFQTYVLHVSATRYLKDCATKAFDKTLTMGGSISGSSHPSISVPTPDPHSQGSRMGRIMSVVTQNSADKAAIPKGQASRVKQICCIYYFTRHSAMPFI